MYSKELIAKISEHADIVTVVSHYLTIKKKGKLYFGLCPFHNDTHPSLQINPERNIFKCWVDGHCGNVFSFVMQYERVSFPEAVKKVAAIVGIDDKELIIKQPKKNSQQEIFFNCLNDLQNYYSYSLYNSIEGEIARQYLQQRQIPLSLAKEMALGFAINDGRKIIRYLRHRGYTLKTIIDLGIAVNNGENSYDRHQGRLTFPFFNDNGQVIAFSSRKIIDNDEVAKYLHSPETLLFTKSKNLYYFWSAIKTARKDKFIYLVEGFMDVIALKKINFNSVVALTGTSLSSDNLLMLKKLKIEIRLCLDSDLAGQKATLTLIELLLKNTLSLNVVNCFKLNYVHLDPDEIRCQNGEEALKTYINDLITPFTFVLNFYQQTQSLTTLTDKKKLLNFFLPFLITLKASLELDTYFDKLSEITGYTVNAIKKLVQQTKQLQLKKQRHSLDETIIVDHNLFIPKNKKLRKLEKVEREILFQMLLQPTVIDFFQKHLKYFNIKIHQQIANFIIAYYQQNNKITVDGLITLIEMHPDDEKHQNEKIINEIINLTQETFHLPCPEDPKKIEELLFDYKEIIDNERERLQNNQIIAKLCDGKNSQEQAAIINNYYIKKNL